ncbi:MAG: PAS domain-containing protein, partial [Chloroflexota bacterium]
MGDKACPGADEASAGTPFILADVEVRLSADSRREASAEHLRVILEGLAVGICSRDRDRRVLYFNPRAEQLTGYKADDLVGKPCRGLFCHHTPAGEILCGEGCPAEGCLREGTASSALALEMRTATGDRLAVTSRFAPVRAPNGEVAGFVETFEAAEPVLAGQRLPTVLLADADPAVRSLLS